MKLYILGFMGSGKSVVGKKLANALNFEFLDTDTAFESKYHITIQDFFSKYGELEFRNLESRLLLDTALLENTVISTGGGTPCFDKNMDFILQNGISIYLNISRQKLFDRITKSYKPRPLVKDFKGKELSEFIDHLMQVREPIYQRANIILHEDDISISCLMKKLAEHPGFGINL